MCTSEESAAGVWVAAMPDAGMNGTTRKRIKYELLDNAEAEQVSNKRCAYIFVMLATLCTFHVEMSLSNKIAPLNLFATCVL